MGDESEIQLLDAFTNVSRKSGPLFIASLSSAFQADK